MRRYIHKEGRRIITNSALIALAVAVIAALLFPVWLSVAIVVLMLLKVAFVLRFFRVPERTLPQDTPGAVWSPADGTVVAIEEVYEEEVLGQKCIQVSVFMSVWNVHINWYPVGGTVEYFRHHHGRFLVAWHPKSSTENERTTTVVRTHDGHRLLFRQIAGFVARRIVSYSTEGGIVERGCECGFIKFGSRVDILLPLGSEIHVKLDEKVTGTLTRIATLPRTTGESIANPAE